MATNNIKPFATAVDANVYTDTELASMSELQTGFKPRSIADSKLVGKLIQDASAGAYAVGQFTANHGTTNVTGSNATEFATAFESALNSFVEDKAPDLSNLATKTELAAKADKTELNNYLPLTGGTVSGNLVVEGSITAAIEGNADTATKLAGSHQFNVGGALTGTAASFDGTQDVTINVTAVNGSAVTGTVPQATADGSGNNIANTYATKSEVSSGYASLKGAAFTGAVTVQEPTAASNPATKQYVDNAVAAVYKYKGSVANYAALPSSNQVVGDVYNVEDTGDNYAWTGTDWDKLAGTVDLSGYLTTSAAASTYLTQANASTTYATKTELNTKADATSLDNYATLTQVNAKADDSAVVKLTGNQTIAGTKTFSSTIAGSINGNAATATKLATARNITLSGDATGSASFNGSANAAIAVTLADSGVTAGSYGPTAAATLAFGGSVNVPQITVDDKGRATTITNRAIKLPAAPTTVSGNAGTATKLATARTIRTNLASTSTASFDGSANITPGVTGTLPLANGGTGATSASAALTNLGGIAKSGSRGALAGYETITSATTVIVSDSSGDDIVASGAVTVSDVGTGTNCWTKTVLLTAASPTVTLGSGWSWVGSDSAPEFSQYGILVLAKRGTRGIANFLAAGG